MKIVEKNRRQSDRKKIDAEVEFIFSADIIKAHSVNISENGIRLDTDSPLEIELRIKLNGRDEDHKAKLCWAEKKGEKGFAYGFQFK